MKYIDWLYKSYLLKQYHTRSRYGCDSAEGKAAGWVAYKIFSKIASVSYYFFIQPQFKKQDVNIVQLTF